MGMTGTAGGSDATTFILSDALGLPIRAVRGYAGSAEIRQAIDAGEVDGTCLNKESFEAGYIPHENYVLAIQGGTEVAAGLENVPLALALTEDPDEQALLEALALMRSIERFYALPPGTPSQFVGLLRRPALDRPDERLGSFRQHQVASAAERAHPDTNRANRRRLSMSWHVEEQQ